MTDPQTIAEWRTSLLTRLNEELPQDQGGASGNRRVCWLAVHLDEYVERWIGFIEHPAVRAEPQINLFESGLFKVIDIALELLEEEVRTVAFNSQTHQIWAELQAVHTELLQTRAP